MFIGLLSRGRAAPGAPPAAQAPSRTAPYRKRTQWSERYVGWVVERMLRQGALPNDVHSTHDYQVEFQACVLDPRAYQAQTQAELNYEVRRLSRREARRGKRGR